MKTPERIELQTEACTLTLYWGDGTTQRLAGRELRSACPCAECRRIRLAGRTPTTAPEVAVVAVHSLGYGVQLVFSDQHTRGIYPWPYLAALESVDARASR